MKQIIEFPDGSQIYEFALIKEPKDSNQVQVIWTNKEGVKHEMWLPKSFLKLTYEY